jgi:hypothetical protein
MDQTITIKVTKYGEISYEMQGFKGATCTEIANILNQREKERKNTPEYYMAGGCPEGVLVGNG